MFARDSKSYTISQLASLNLHLFILSSFLFSLPSFTTTSHSLLLDGFHQLGRLFLQSILHRHQCILEACSFRFLTSSPNFFSNSHLVWPFWTILHSSCANAFLHRSEA